VTKKQDDKVEKAAKALDKILEDNDLNTLQALTVLEICRVSIVATVVRRAIQQSKRGPSYVF